LDKIYVGVLFFLNPHGVTNAAAIFSFATFHFKCHTVDLAYFHFSSCDFLENPKKQNSLSGS
jgi:hypothetical protein